VTSEQETEEVSQVSLIAEHPIPISEGRAEDLQHENETFVGNDYLMHPDELHERFKNVLAENHEWRVFRSGIYGHEGYVFMWNHQLGYGLRFYDEDGSFRSFVEAMMRAAEEVA